MEFNVLTVIIIITIVVSIKGFSDGELKGRLMYIPYDVKHYNNYIRVFGHILIHADYGHLAFNMFSLYFLGDIFLNAEAYTYVGITDSLTSVYGSVKGQAHFLILYVLGGLFATLIPYIRHHDNISYKSLGASGAVSAVIFAAILWNPTVDLNLLFIPIDIPAYVFGPLYLAFEFYQDKKGNTGIAHDAHIGGAIFGIVYVLIINIDKGKDFLDIFI
ncbi:rhomboid family intramembrane serine protease [Crocinitomicaceae bacterium]|jgi:membrane associated rhomboid family serine protease|nr:rhomboid family intramembrane serine protease [Crocinitomicaceae bacterium]MDC1282914.1 rhomboid family intramembrane serine protease [Crocinitomicaceae bacterium]MDC1384630.1 rhomboid family intramembrane serine protease [Crocinitomicaceae bacterium]|tara:strand:- start:5141 stop:5791 length:651 start_codon:yes stop_codon:yes gene_type:complete